MDPTTGSEALEVPVVPSPEGGDNVEKRPSRETVLAAFNSAFEFFKDAPEASLNNEEQAARDHIQEIKERTLDRGNDSYVKSFTGPDGKRYTQTEHIPLEGLLAFLSKKAAEATIDNNSQLKDELYHHLDILSSKKNKVGVPYLGVPRRSIVDAKYRARVNSELKRIQDDPRLSSGDPNTDYYRAHELSTKRWELIIPKDGKNSVDIKITPLPTTEGPTPDGRMTDSEIEKAKDQADKRPPTNEEEQELFDKTLEKHKKESEEDKEKSAEDDAKNLEKALKIATDNGLDPESVKKTVQRIKDGELVPKNFSDYDPALKKAVLIALGQDISATSTPPQNESAHPTDIAKLGTFRGQKPGTGTAASVDASMEESYPIYEAAGGLRNNAPEPQTAFPDGAGEISADQIPNYLPETGTYQTPPAESPTVEAEISFPDGAGEIAPSEIPGYLAEEPSIAPVEDAPAETVTAAATPSEPADTAAVESEDTSEEEPPMTPPTLEEVIHEYVAIIGNETTHPRKRASAIAQEHLRAEMKRGKIWNPKDIARKIKLRTLEEYYRQKWTKEVTQAMLEHGDSFLTYDFARKAASSTNESLAKSKSEERDTLERVALGGLITNKDLKKPGEEEKGEKDIEITGEVRTKLLVEIIRPIASGALTDEKDIQEKLKAFIARTDIKDDPVIKELFGKESTKYGIDADFFATNLLEMGKKVKADADAHGYALERMDEFIKIKLANTSWAANTDIQWTLTDKLIAWSQRNNKRGWFTNPTVVGAVASIGLYGGMRVAGYSGKALIAAPLVGTLIGASFSAVRRAHDLKVDRALHQIQSAYTTEKTPEDAKRRKTLDRYALSRVSVDALLNGGIERKGKVTGTTRGLAELIRLDISSNNPESALIRDEIIERRAEIRARLDYSFTNGVDLIQFSSKDAVAHGRLELIKSMAEAKIKLREAGLSDERILAADNEKYAGWSNKFLENQKDQDRAFNIYRFRQSAISAGIGSASGLVVGLGATYLAREAIEHSGVHTYVAGLEKVPGINKLTGKSQNVKEHMQSLNQENKSTKVGNITLSTDSAHHVITTTPDGVSQVHDNWTIDGNGHLLATGGDVPPNIANEFKMQGFDISEHIQQQDVSILTESTKLAPSDVAGHHIMVPDGTGWLQNSKDPTHWDLVMSDHRDKILLSDVQFKPDGSVAYDHAASLLGDNALTSHQEIVQQATNETHAVLGPDGDWTKNSTALDHREWYAYDTPGSDGNELRMYDSVFTTPDGQRGVTLDMSGMTLGYEKGLNPNPIDVQQVIRDHQAVWSFSTPDNQGHPIVIKEGADGFFDGHLRLSPSADPSLHIDPSDPNSMTLAEASKILLNQNALQKLPDGGLASEVYNHQDVFNVGSNGQMGFIEAGRLVDGPNGKTLQAFATIRGGGPTPPTVDVGRPEISQTVFDTVPKTIKIPQQVHITEFAPPGEHEIPIIPIPFSPRNPLEDLEAVPAPPPPLPPYYSYGYGLEVLSPEQQQQVRSRYSDRLKADPDATLDASVEIPDYFRRQSPEHIAQLEQYLRQPGMTETMNDNCDAVVCIPVYDLGEGQAIEKTLEQYLLQIDKTKNQQAIEPEKFELLLFLNHPEGKRENKERELGHAYTEGAEARVRAGAPEPYDTEEVIRQFQLSHPELKIRVMKREYDGANIKPWGTIIKDHYDAALYRASKRPNPSHKDPLILTNDADLVNVSPTYMRDILQYMDQNDLESTREGGRRLDAIVGKIDMPNQGYEKEPGFLAAERLYQFLDAQQRKKPNRSAITQGRNTIIRGSSYAAMGGPLESYGAGADTLLGGAIRDARRGTKTIDYINKAWLYSDPRRELDKWQNNVPLAYAWNNWGDTGLYGEGWQARFKNIPKNTGRVDIAKLQRDISAEQWRWGLELDSPELKRALAWLGLKPTDYHLGKIKDFDSQGNEIEKDGIVIDNSAKLEQQLKDFQTEKRWEKADRRTEKALNATPTAQLNDKYYAEYTDYEEFDRLKADIFGVFGDGSDSEYPWKPNPSNPSPTIIDLGAHIGVSALWWKNLAPNAKITAVEANPGLYPLLERNVARNNIQADVKVIQGAVTSQSGNVKFFSPKAGQGWNWEGFIADTNPNPSKYDEVEVPSIQLSSLITGPVDLLKLDIEGSEVASLREAEPKLSQVKEIMMEFHNNPDNPTNSFNDAIEILRRQGYVCEVRLNNQPITDFKDYTIDDRFNLTILAKRPSASSTTTPPAPIPALRPSAPITTPTPLTYPVAPTPPITPIPPIIPVPTTPPLTVPVPPTTPPTPLTSPVPPATPIPPTTPTPITSPVPPSTPPAPSPEPETPEAPDPVPDTVLSKITTQLSSESGSSSNFEMTQSDLSEYVKSLSLPQGAKINDFKTQVEGDHLVVGGNVTARGGNSSFAAQIKTTPDGKIVVENQTINPALRHRPFVGNIQRRIADLDVELTNALNAQLSNGWKVEGFGLNGANINIKFGKTP